LAEDEIHRLLSEDPAQAVARVPALIQSSAPDQLPALAAAILELYAVRLARFADGAASCAQAVARFHDTPSEDLDRVHAVLLLLSGDVDGAETVLAQFGPRRPSHEAWATAHAALATATHGRLEEAVQWLQRAASLAFAVPDGDPSVREVARVSNDLAERLEQQAERTAVEVTLLRAASQYARVYWERAGTWREVAGAELRLSKTALALGEWLGAVAHAEACIVILRGNGASETEITEADGAYRLAKASLSTAPSP